jgi:hypothetical protein
VQVVGHLSGEIQWSLSAHVNVLTGAGSAGAVRRLLKSLEDFSLEPSDPLPRLYRPT